MAIRWTVALAVGLMGAVFAAVLLSAGTVPATLPQTLALTTTALAVYAWLLYPPSGGITVGVLSLLLLAWAWGVRQDGWLGVSLVACGGLLAVAAMERRRRMRRLLRLQQAVEDLSEERTVKDQAITTASQTREALNKKLSRYSQLQAIAEELSNMTDLTSIAQLAVERAFRLIGKSDTCLLFLLDQEQQELSLVASKKHEALSSIRSKHGDQFDRYVLRTHKPLLVNDVRRDFRFTVAASPERPISSVIACPLLLGQSPEGVLRLDSAQPSTYTQDDLRFLDILLDLVGTAVTNAKLFARTQQLAMTDGLTGLTLRRPFLEQFTRELTRAARTKEPASVLMLDVDHFKDYNDAFGHTAGDLILRAIAEVLRTVVPPGGVIARYGGEEFAVLLPRLPRTQAADLAEKLRRVVEQQVHGSPRAVASHVERSRRSEPAAAEQAVTVSVGVASFPEDGQVELELMRVADRRLYEAKRSGRNLVCAA